MSPEDSVEPMATNKERMAELEASHGMMQNEMQRMTVAMVDLKGDLEDRHRRMEESLNRLMEAVTQRDSGGTAASRGSRRSEGNQYHTAGARADPDNPFAAAANEHQGGNARPVKLDFPRFHGGDPTEWLS